MATPEPLILQAPKTDVELAKTATPRVETPLPAPKQDVEAIRNAIDLQVFNREDQHRNGLPSDTTNLSPDDRGWDRKVRQFDSSWVQYDRDNRPVISNPYPEPMQIVYPDQNEPRIATAAPLSRIVLNVTEFAAYSFTALAINAVNNLINVAVGSFFGGSYVPAAGVALPAPPQVSGFGNVPVQVRYSQAVYEPFTVRRVVDVGDDVRYGERKVLLDGVTPAWGVWTHNSTGQRQFEVHTTQQFPGLEDPGEGPLPGDYQLRLASNESSPGLTTSDVYLITAASVITVLGFTAIAWSLLLGRRRSQQ